MWKYDSILQRRTVNSRMFCWVRASWTKKEESALFELEIFVIIIRAGQYFLDETYFAKIMPIQGNWNSMWMWVKSADQKKDSKKVKTFPFAIFEMKRFDFSIQNNFLFQILQFYLRKVEKLNKTFCFSLNKPLGLAHNYFFIF